ncbi:hypothetical protein SAMN04487830_12936 [Pseudobutyrivibrio sp. OR37]|uniref:hypothetical protein n=1 Tax=Pseudobutyrivibrio sp. OR37 TaxID=1798186 RepID=UPI0008F2C69F|nr:hypothetical protein [Pseudobutyrivibrio sp. OR37]SFI19604.1 hypothetical protein SAMN04487830_12936 [Pseudobutyrivibrio sp. OR37]
MFERFGNLDTADAINKVAEEIKATGDEEKLKALCEENGIDQEDAEDYMDGVLDELVTPLSAALGKLRAEEAYLKLGGILTDWVDELRNECINDEKMQQAVRSSSKELAGYIAALAENGYENRCVVSPAIVKQTKTINKLLNGHEFSIGVPDKATRLQLMKDYYLS